MAEGFAPRARALVRVNQTGDEEVITVSKELHHMAGIVDRLHYTVLQTIRHGTEHCAFVHKMVAQSGGWGEASDAVKTLRGQLGKQKQAVEMRINNYVKVIGNGRMSDAIVSALEKAEAERASIIEAMERADAEIAASTLKRPEASDVQEAWTRIMKFGMFWPTRKGQAFSGPW